MRRAISASRGCRSTSLATAIEVSTMVSSSRSRARRAASCELPPIARASSSMSSTAIRRWPPAVRVQGRNPVAVQRRMVTGETPSRRAA